MKAYLAVAVVLVMGLAVIGISQAQEEETEYSYGTVISASAKQVVVSEYDFENGEETETSYAIDAETEMDGVESVSDISAGDIIDIEYVIKNGKNVAKSLFVEKPSQEVPAEGYEEEQPFVPEDEY